MITKLRSAFFVLFMVAAAKGFAQAPNISYASPQVYNAASAISTLSPVNTGGVVPAPVVSTLPGSFVDITGITTDAAGNVYLADGGSNTVREIPVGGGPVLTLASGFTSPIDVAVDAAGNVYVTDYPSDIKEILAGTGNVIVIASGLSHPYGIATDAAGDIYFSEYGSGDVRELPGGGTSIVIGKGFRQPKEIAVDESGNVYVNDSGHDAIKKILAANHTVITIPSGDLGLEDFTADGSGNVYFVDSNDILEIPVGGEPFSIGSVSNPFCLATDTKGDIFVADMDGTVVKEFGAGNYSLKPALPYGLIFNTSTGIITGTPTGASAAANYTVTATNSSGSSTAVINIAVNLPAVPAISYSTPQVYTAAQSITPLSPASSGGAIPSSGAFSVSPALPAGLAFDTNTGVISGTPSGTSAATNYTVTATNLGGSGTFVVNIAVKPPAPPAISYRTPQVYVASQAVTSILPTNTGGAIPSAGAFSVTPLLPPGVTFDVNTGAIGGTPRSTAAATNYTVTATNLGGSGSAVINITVNPYPAPNISYASPQLYNIGISITPLAPANTGGAAQTAVTISAEATDVRGIAIDAAGNLYVTNLAVGNAFVSEIPADGGSPVVIANGFNSPSGIACDAVGNVFVVDQNTGILSKIAAGTHTVTTLVSGFVSPLGLAIDAAGNFFVSDIAEYGSNGIIKKVPAGSTNIISLAHGFNYPFGLAVDAAGNIFFAEAGAKSIKEILVTNGSVKTLATGLANPYGVALDGAGNIYVADSLGVDMLKNPVAGGKAVNLYHSATHSSFAIATGAAGQVFFSEGESGVLKLLYPGGYTTNPALPTGLSIDLNTGVISGTPSGVSPATYYTVTATNFGGSGTAVINIAVTSPAIPALSYSTPQVFTAAQAITPLSPTSSGGPTPPNAFSISPALPPGFVFNSNTGVISGTPSGVSAATNYTVTATNAGGSATFVINIAVNAPAAPAISYSTPQVYTTTETITPLLPTNSGGAIPSGAFSVAPALPVGLTFNINTGAITGTPTNAVAAANYTVTATNLGGSATAVVNITVVDVSPVLISYSSPQSYPIGLPVTALSPSSSHVDATGPGSVTAVPGPTFTQPLDVAVDAAGNVYVADYGANSVVEIPANGSPAITLGSGFNEPANIAVDAAGNVYVSDTGNGAIKKIPAGNGTVVTIASGLSIFGIAIDAPGNLYFSDYYNNKVMKIPAHTSTPFIIGSGFNGPEDLAVDVSGNVYVVDRNNYAVKEILAGTGATVTVASATGVAYGVAVDPSGNVYFGSSESVEEIQAGTHAIVQLSDGPEFPVGFAVGVGNANLYFAADFDKIYKLTPTGGYYITPALPAGLAFSSSTGVISGTPTTLSRAKNYTVTAYNAGGSGTSTLNLSVYSTNAGLANLALSNGTLSPAFATATTHYTANVGNSLTTFTVTPTTADSTATVTVNGTAVSYGSPSGYIPLSLGDNTITILVTAEDGVTTQTYTLVVHKAESQNADLSNIALSSGTVSPVFVPALTSYTAIVDNSVSSITLTPTVSLSTSTVTVNGIPVTSGSPSASIPLTVGTNTITITGTAQNGATKTYTVSVTRSSNVNVYLSSLTASNGLLIPDFSPGATIYNVYVGNLLSTMTLTPTLADPAATVTINGSAVTSGLPSPILPLAVGSNTFHVVVTGSDGTTTLTYTVIVHESKSEDNYLASLTTSSGFAQGLTVPESMTQIVTNEPSAIRVTPTVRDPTATVTVNGAVVASGSPSALIPLTKAAHTITIVVTAQDQSTRTYTLTVAQVPTASADLSDIRMNKGVLSPAFAGNVLSYQDTVSNGTTSIALTPVAVDPWASITVNGKTVLSGKQSGPISLPLGLTTITTVVTSSDGTTQKTYTVYVLRPSLNTKITNILVHYGKKVVFNWVYYYYDDPLEASVYYVPSETATITAWLEDSNASMTVNGVPLQNKGTSAPIAVQEGSNIITIVATAQDHVTTETYTFTLTAVAETGANTPDAEVSVDKPAEVPQLAQDGITVHQGISPNGDGINDFLQIDNITQYPENHLKIMNRNGQLIYEAKGYDNATKVFDGHSNKTGQMQLPGTYFYSLDYTVNGVVKHQTGFLVLKY